MARKFSPIHPGEILAEESLRPLAISQYRLSKDIGVPPRRVNGKRGITADTALRPARHFRASPEFQMSLRTTTTWSRAGTPPAAASSTT